MSEGVLSRKRQITIPRHLAEQVGIYPHDTVWVTVVEDEIRIRKAPENLVSHYAGLLSEYFAVSEKKAP